MLRKKYPWFKILLAKRDISNAFKRVLIRPDVSRVFSHQFRGEDVGIARDFGVSFLDLPFGFLASPSYFCLVTSAIQAIHQNLGPECEDWNTLKGFRAWCM